MSNSQPPKKRIHRKRRSTQKSEQKSTPLILYLALAGGIGVVVTVGVLIAVLSSQETDVPLAGAPQPIPQTQPVQPDPATPDALAPETSSDVAIATPVSPPAETHNDAPGGSAELAPDFTRTLEIDQEEIIVRLSKPDAGLEFGPGPPVDGKTTVLGISDEKAARANLIGEPRNLYSVTVTKAFTGSGLAATNVDTTLFRALFEAAASDWDKGYETFQANLAEANSKGGAIFYNDGKAYIIRWVSPLLMVGIYEEEEGRKVAEASGLNGGE